MTQEDKQLLLTDLCARLPHGLKLRYVEDLVVKKESHVITLNNIYLEHILNGDADIKPYLRPMYSMTDEEKKEFQACHCVYELHPDFQPMMCNLANELNMFNWLNAHHFDYRGLIPMGLALEAPEDMYKNE